MTLDFKKLLKNSLLKQMSIQHVELPVENIQIFKRQELAECQKVLAQMKKLYGENSQLDADYFIFFSNAGTELDFNKEFVDKTLFKVVNSAMGNSANDMKENELRMFQFDGPSADPVVSDTDIDDTDLTTDDSDQANSEAVADLVYDDNDGDSGDKQVDESVEAPVTGEKFVFVKLTMK